MATFTSWAAVVTACKDIIASGSFLRSSSITIDGDTKILRDIDDVIKLLAYAENRAALDAGTMSFRVYAKNGGRG